jgi:hypothetical protein
MAALRKALVIDKRNPTILGDAGATVLVQINRIRYDHDKLRPCNELPGDLPALDELAFRFLEDALAFDDNTFRRFGSSETCLSRGASSR